MTLTNYELAKNSSFPIVAAFLGCPQCNYLTHSLELTNSQVPCPKCNVQGLVRYIFPDVSSIKLLEMIAYFYVKACDRADNLQIKLISDLWDKVSRKYELESAINLAREIQNFYKKSEGGQAEYDQILEIIRQRLCLESNEQAQRVFVTLFRYSDTFEEHKVIVILTCTLLETLFGNLLVLILIHNGMIGAKAVKKVRKLSNFQRRCKEFENVTGLSLEEVIGQCSIPDFFSDWNEVRNTRNNFIHGTPFAIGVATAEKGFTLAKNAFSVFAYLQNRFCIKQV